MEGGSVAVGFDTSNYTTSICAVDGAGGVVHEDRVPLRVPAGERGLMQSAALFQHVAHLPPMLDRLGQAVADRQVLGVAVSAKPRLTSGSYMPVFRAGVLAATAFAAGRVAFVAETSHQSGHIAAGLATAEPPLEASGPFLAIHLSGGTTDLLQVEPSGADFSTVILATGKDLHAGQFVDRIGVLMGLPFPCGRHLETLSATWEDSIPIIPSSVVEGRPSFSGPLSAAERLLADGKPPAAIAAGVERSIAAAVEKMARYGVRQTGLSKILVVGGVASNMAVRARLVHRFGQGIGQRTVFHFCAPHYATDNAFGVARIALRMAEEKS